MGIGAQTAINSVVPIGGPSEVRAGLSGSIAFRLLDASDECVFAVDREWRFIYANTAAIAQISPGISPIGKYLWTEFPDACGTIFESSYRRALRDKEQVSFEAYCEKLASWYEICATPIPDCGLAVWFRNIDERKQEELALKLAEDRYRLAASAAADLVTEWDIPAGKFTCYHPAGSRLGCAEPVILDEKECAERIHPEDRVRVIREVERCLAGEDRLISQCRFLKFDGEYAEVEQRSVLQRNIDGRPLRLISALRDVTTEIRAEQELKRREVQLGRVFNQAIVGMMEADAEGRPRMVNQRFCEIVGRSEAELKRCTYHDYTHPDDLPRNIAVMEQCLRTGEPFELEKRYIRPDGSVVWCKVYVSFVQLDDGTIDGTIIVAEDITARRATETALRNSELLHRSVLEASQDCIKILSIDGKLEYVNPAGARALELDGLDGAIGAPWAGLWPEHSRDLVQGAVEAAAQGENIRFTAQCPTSTGKTKWWDVLACPIRRECGAVRRILVISRDITDQRANADHLKWSSEHDFLTELPNRRAFEAHLQAALIRAMEANSSVGLLLLDLDHFKHVNDTLGHAAGDHLLAVISTRLRTVVRKGDFVARLGGDEFAIIVESEPDALDLKATGEAILSRLRVPVRFQQRMISANASIGGAIFPANAHSAKELLTNADIALYALKEAGRGGTKMFEQYMREQSQLVASQLNLARRAVEQESIVPHYQPKVDLVSGRVVGWEALLRWRHRSRGFQAPETISAAFKDYELASRIGAGMQAQVFGDLRDWLDRGVPVGFVAINAAPAEFLRDDFAERFLAAMELYDIPPAMIEVEITEHVFLEQGGSFVARALGSLKEAGVRIALDDFGTGYSSLSHLRDFPVDVVKIDRSFIEVMNSDPEVQAIVSAVIRLAWSLQIEVVAEGVESLDQREALIREGCAMGQGYLFGKAAAREEVPTLLSDNEGKWRHVA